MSGKRKSGKTEQAAFAAGCFWGVEEAFRNMKGVVMTEAGFMGGRTKNPSYRLVCTGLTGHAETVRLEYDPKRVQYGSLLGKFWSIHDPTTRNRQGLDIGSQYRSVIFYYDEKQRKAALASMEKAQKNLKKRIATSVEPAKEFYKAEEHHQKYLMKKGLKTCQ